MTSIPAQLRELRETAGILQLDLADALGVVSRTLCRWEHEQASPKVGQVTAWAAVLDRWLVVVRDGVVVGELMAILTLMPRMRYAAGRTQDDLAAALYASRDAIGHAERTAGPMTRLSTVQRQLGLLRCEIRLEPISETPHRQGPEMIDPADLRRIVLIHHGTGQIEVRTMTSEQASATWDEVLDADRNHPGETVVRLIDVTMANDEVVRVTPEAADQLVAAARTRKAHPAL